MHGWLVPGEQGQFSASAVGLPSIIVGERKPENSEETHTDTGSI